MNGPQPQAQNQSKPQAQPQFQQQPQANFGLNTPIKG
jgi:hypothetical protein